MPSYNFSKLESIEEELCSSDTEDAVIATPRRSFTRLRDRLHAMSTSAYEARITSSSDSGYTQFLECRKPPNSTGF